MGGSGRRVAIVAVVGAAVIEWVSAAPAVRADTFAPAQTRIVSLQPARSTTTKRVYPTVEAVEAARIERSAQALAAQPLQPQLTYGGGRNGIGVTLAPMAYVVFWGSQWGTANPPGSTNFSGDSLGLASRVVALLSGIGTNNEQWSGVMTQYCEGIATDADFCSGAAAHVGYPDGGAFAGFWADTAAPAPAAASAGQIAAEAVNAAAHFGNTTAASNRNAQYVVVSPTGTHPDGFNAGGGFCAWHDFTGSPYGDLAFTNLPYVPDMGTSCGANFVNPGTSGTLDGVTMVEGHEYAETITDQNPAGGWLDSRGLENADKCAWLSTGTGRAQNVTFATGTFAMQGTWSNADRSCEIAHPIWGSPDGPDDFAIEASPRSGYVQPGEDAHTTVLSARVSGNAQTIQLSVSGAPAGVTVSLSTDSLTTDDGAALALTTSSSTPYGTYPMTITADGSVTHVATYTLVVGPAPSPLQPWVAATGLSGAVGSDQYFYVDLPDAYVMIDFTIGGGTGNADLFASAGTLPTDDDYQCVSATAGNLDTCDWFHSGGNRWYLRVHGTTSYSGLSIQASPVTIFGQPANRFAFPLSGTAGSAKFLFVRPPASAKQLTITVTGMKPRTDVDLFVRRFALPTPFANECASARRGRRLEKCVFKPVSGGTYYIGVYGITDFTNVKMKSVYR